MCSIKKKNKDFIKNFTIKQAEAITDQFSSQIDTYIAHKLTMKHNTVKDPETGIKIIRQTVRNLNFSNVVYLEFIPYNE